MKRERGNLDRKMFRLATSSLIYIDTKDSANLEDVDGDAEWIFRVALFSEGKCEEQCLLGCDGCSGNVNFLCDMCINGGKYAWNQLVQWRNSGKKLFTGPYYDHFVS